MNGNGAHDLPRTHTPTRRRTLFCRRQPSVGYWRVSRSRVIIMRWNAASLRTYRINSPYLLCRKKGDNVLCCLFSTSLVILEEKQSLHAVCYILLRTWHSFIICANIHGGVKRSLRIRESVRREGSGVSLVRDFQEMVGTVLERAIKA